MRFARLIPVSALACAGAIAISGSASASTTISPPLGGCASETLGQVFLPWLDPSQYTLAPGGSFEDSAASPWTLAGGAAVAGGNETYYVTAATDSHSLALPAGSGAVSPTVCIDIAHPTLRFFARNTGPATSTLSVSLKWTDPLGAVTTLPMGTVTASSEWQPIPVPLAIPVSLLPVAPGSWTPVSFSFAVSGGAWSIDDVYVDPYGRS